jgi:hypothetical protein
MSRMRSIAVLSTRNFSLFYFTFHFLPLRAAFFYAKQPCSLTDNEITLAHSAEIASQQRTVLQTRPQGRSGKSFTSDENSHREENKSKRSALDFQ